MPCFLFVLDSSGSMSTRAHPQFSFFDLAKNYIETFIKVRSRNDSRMVGRENDRYFLLTTQSKYPENVKVLSEKAGGAVIEELKRLHLPYGTTQLHTAILDAFHVLHVNRVQTGIDGVGTGRAIQNTEQIVIILLTDGSGVAGIPGDFRLHFDPPFLGSEMTREAFRWDQKLYTVVFRIPSTPYRPTNSQLSAIDIDMPVIEKLCARTGGRSFSIVSIRQIQTSIDAILFTANQHRIAVRFECLPAIPAIITQDDVSRVKAKFKKVTDKKPVTNLISRVNPQGRPVSCHWPIPESYFPMRNMDQLPPRTAHPIILCAPIALPLVIRNDIPVDKLELESGGVSDVIMEILQNRRDLTVWTYIEGSSNGPTAPFGCLRMNALGNGVTMILLPFNFPCFYPLVDEVVREPQLTGSTLWRQKLDSYFQTVPYYYYTQMRICLDKIKVKVDYQTSMSNIYAGQLLSNLNRLKTKAKEEFDHVGITSKLGESKPKMNNPTIRIERITSRSAIVGLGTEDDDYEEENLEGFESTPIFSGDFQIPLYPPVVMEAEMDNTYRTPYTSSIDEIVGKLNRLQANVELMFDPEKNTILDMARLGSKPRFNTLEETHNMPMKLMGEYEPYQAARVKFYGQPMRKIDEERDRSHAFGNPYKLKGLGAGVDEVMDSAVVDNNSPNQMKRFPEGIRIGGGPPKRKRGPLSISAFDQWRTRRSIRGSTASSDISEISPSSIISDEKEIEEILPGPSVEDKEPETPVTELENFQLQEMDTEDILHENLNAVEAMRQSDEAKKSPPAPSVRSLSPQEVVNEKTRIGAIVRKPANLRAYEEIVSITNGLNREFSRILLTFAVRESQRFKTKQLTNKLQTRLSSL